MKIAIIGSRKGIPPYIVTLYISTLPPDTIIVSGGATGVDLTAEDAAIYRGLKTMIFRPNFTLYPGNEAYFKRNEQIAEACDEMVAFHNGYSRGTKHAIACAKSLNKPVTIFSYPKESGK